MIKRKKAAQVLAYIFHPLNMPLFGLLLLLYTPCIPNSFLIIDSFYYLHPALKTMLLLLFGLFTWVGPVLTILLLKRTGEIRSFEMEHKEDRKLPLGFMVFFYLIFFSLVYFYIPENRIPTTVSVILFAGFLGLLIARFINETFKISLHALGMGMLTGAIYTHYLEMAVYPIWMLPALFLTSGVVISSRIYLGRHNLRESLYGYGLGFLVQLATGIAFYG